LVTAVERPDKTREYEVGVLARSQILTLSLIAFTGERVIQEKLRLVRRNPAQISPFLDDDCLSFDNSFSRIEQGEAEVAKPRALSLL